MTIVETIFKGTRRFGPAPAHGPAIGKMAIAGLAALGSIHRLGLAKLGGRLVERVHGLNVGQSGPEVKS